MLVIVNTLASSKEMPLTALDRCLRYKIGGSSMKSLVAELLFFFLDYRFTLVSTAVHTYVVRQNGFTALRAK